MGGTVGKSLCRCGHAALVVQGAARRTHAWGYDQEVWPAGFADFLRFFRRRHYPVQSGCFGQLCQSQDLLRNGIFIIQIGKLLLVHAGEDGDRQQLRAFYAKFCRFFSDGSRCRFHHLFSAYGMDVDHVHAQFRFYFQSAGYRIGNVLEF